MLSFFRTYPWQTFVMLVALLLAGIAEGIGLSALLPMLNIAISKDAGAAGGDASPMQQNAFEQFVTESLARNGIDPSITVLLTIIVLGVTVKSLLLLVAQKKVGYTAARIATDLRLQMLRSILRSRWEYFLHQPIGKLTNALATEAQRASDAFVNGATVITFLIHALIYGGIAFAVSWKASLVSLTAGLVVMGISHFLVRMARQAGKKQTSLLNSLMAGLTDTLQSVKPLKAMAREHLADRVLAMETSRLNRALQRQVFSSAMLNAAQEEMFAIIIALGIFVALVQFEMPLATVMVLVVTLGRMLAFLGKVQKQFQKMVISESAYWSIKRAISDADTAREQLGAGKVPSLRDGIRFQAVQFAYAKQAIFDDLSLAIEAGALTTLIGPSGAGKTTFVDLIIGLMRPQSGTILVDSIPLQELNMQSWRRMIGYVPQETVLLHDTVAHNVTLGDPELSDADTERALRAADAWEFVSAQEEGMHTMVGERGGKLSGGQRQRIVIARALVHKPSLLILDEATSALDPASEQAICKTIEKLRGELTILAISHQTALVEVADCVYRLENGQALAVEDSATLRAVSD
ncbi:MAG: ABC transporter ATP-binding protein [Pseudomonadales bacterium]